MQLISVYHCKYSYLLDDQHSLVEVCVLVLHVLCSVNQVTNIHCNVSWNSLSENKLKTEDVTSTVCLTKSYGSGWYRTSARLMNSKQFLQQWVCCFTNYWSTQKSSVSFAVTTKKSHFKYKLHLSISVKIYKDSARHEEHVLPNYVNW